jgi:hypothetical protein
MSSAIDIKWNPIFTTLFALVPYVGYKMKKYNGPELNAYKFSPTKFTWVLVSLSSLQICVPLVCNSEWENDNVNKSDGLRRAYGKILYKFQRRILEFSCSDLRNRLSLAATYFYSSNNLLNKFKYLIPYCSHSPLWEPEVSLSALYQATFITGIRNPMEQISCLETSNH